MGRGKHQSTLRLIEASIEILEEIQPASVRAVCYQLFNRKLIPDMSVNSTKRVSHHLTNARENGELNWDWIVDETRAAETISSWENPARFMSNVKNWYRKDLWREQPRDVEVWSEKGTVRGTLGPVLEEYGVTFRVMHGFGSATSLHTAAEESRYRGFDVLYVGDYDPSGLYMSEVDAPNRLEQYEGDVTVFRIALIRSDCTSALPSFSASEKGRDTRYPWFVENYGHTCWELDAMNPNDLRGRVEEKIMEYIDWEAWERSKAAEAAEVATIKEVCGGWIKSIRGQDPK